MNEDFKMKELEFMNEAEGYINELNGVRITDAGIGAYFRAIYCTSQMFCTKNTHFIRNAFNDPSIDEYKAMINMLQEFVKDLEKKDLRE